MVDKKISALNLRISDKRNKVPVVQGTQELFSNPEMMREDLLLQEDEGTVCSK